MQSDLSLRMARGSSAVRGPADSPARRPAAAPPVTSPTTRTAGAGQARPSGPRASKAPTDLTTAGSRPARSSGRTRAAAPSADVRPLRAPGATADKSARAAAPKPRASALRDLSRPIARDSRMSQRRPVRIGYGLIAGAIATALIAALVVLPIRRWWNQRDELAERRSELEILERANGAMQLSVDALNTKAGIEAAIRDELDLMYPGEDRISPVGQPNAPTAMPDGYPYTLVRNILLARVTIADQAAAAATTTIAAPVDPVATVAPVATIAPPSGDPTAPPSGSPNP